MLKLHVLVLLGMLTLLNPSYARDWRIGYGLVYSLNTLTASHMDSTLNDLKPGGHSSFFMIETQIYGPFSLIMSPGAMNFEQKPEQLHVQYNLLALSYKMPTRIFPYASIGYGGCIATLTKGFEWQGKVQEGTFIRNSTFLWEMATGLGYRFDNQVELMLDFRGLGFVNALSHDKPKFSNLNSWNLGGTVNFKL